MASDDDFTPPWVHLLNELDNYEEEHEEFYAPPSSQEEELLYQALKEMSEHALDALRGGQIPPEIDQKLAQYKPWEPLDERVIDLLSYNYVQRRLEFDVAREALLAQQGVEKRLRVLLIGFMLLQRSRASDTAFKYLRQASRMYLAGYQAEVFLMCGAVLEAAMAHRFPDDQLRSLGVAPQYRTTGVYSIGQRMGIEKREPIFNDELRQQFWQIVNWRNDVAHVQLDIASDPAFALLEVANLLGVMLPKGAA